jgi:peroxiredoxin
MQRRFFFPAAVLVALWTGSLWVHHQGELAARPRPPARPVPAPAALARRPVTPGQLTAAGALADRPIGPLTALAADGSRLGWRELSGGRPVVLVFVRRGCPCSVEFQPHFSRLARAYRGRARFAGVLDGPVAAARDFAEANGVHYPVLADPELALIRRFQVRNGAYVALVTAGGRLATLWPGCSTAMMRELDRRLAGLTGGREQRLEFAGLPAVLTTGCPFNVTADEPERSVP